MSRNCRCLWGPPCAPRRKAAPRSRGLAASGGHFENELEFNGNSEREICNAVDESAGILIRPKDILQQFRGPVRDPWLIVFIALSGDHDAESDNPSDLVNGSQMLSCDSKGVVITDLIVV
jgi:hypothetical protein